MKRQSTRPASGRAPLMGSIMACASACGAGHRALRFGEEGHVSETPSYKDVLHALRARLAGSPQLRYQPAEDIGHDLMTNGYLSTEPDPALVREALAEIGDDEGGAA
jgi:hypothetical protein